MRKITVMILIVSLLACSAAWAQGPVEKLSRGLCNIATFYFEIFEQSKKVKAEEGSLAGMTYGLGRGLLMACVRALIGVYEVVTFPVPLPEEGYAPILTDPVSFFPEPQKSSGQ